MEALVEDMPRDVVVHILRRRLDIDTLRGLGIAPGRLVVPAALEHKLSESCRLHVQMTRRPDWRLAFFAVGGNGRQFYHIYCRPAGCNIMLRDAGGCSHWTCYWSGASIPDRAPWMPGTARCGTCYPPDELCKFVIIVLLAGVAWVLRIIRLW